jgi:hypothetical protein
MRFLRFPLRLLASLALAAALGLASAYLAARYLVSGDAAATNGPWVTNLAAGAPAADPYTRASIALTGLLALSKEETIYYNATQDSAGEALDGRCSYRIEGRDPDARWWSLTVYGSDHFLIDTPGNRYSVSKTSVVRNGDGTFVVRLSTIEEAGNWVATSPDGFQVTLRLYNPSTAVANDPATVPLPAIVKEGCT